MSHLTVLSGPSGVGKGTVVAAVRRRHPAVWVSVSATTRAPRQEETDGVEYLFVDRTRFAEMVRAGEMLEHAEYAGNLYGTPFAAVQQHLAMGTSVLLEIDLQGARQVRAAMPDAQLVFLAPPSEQELERRLVGRATEAAEARELRMAVARAEIAAQDEFDAVVVNHDVEQAADELVSLVADPVCCRGRSCSGSADM